MTDPIPQMTVSNFGVEPFQIWLGHITQTSTTDPVVTEILNQLGVHLTATYGDVGEYQVTFPCATGRGLLVFIGPPPDAGDGALKTYAATIAAPAAGQASATIDIHSNKLGTNSPAVDRTDAILDADLLIVAV